MIKYTGPDSAAKVFHDRWYFLTGYRILVGQVSPAMDFTELRQLFQTNYLISKITL